MAKSQLNNLSKRQILESLMYEQNQSSATLSKLVTAVARAANLDPQKLAELFIDDAGNQEFIDTFNKAVKEMHAKKINLSKPDPNLIDESVASRQDSASSNMAS